MKKNEIFTAEITAYSSEGLGICRINNTVVFVPESAVGDILDVRITKILSSYAFGRKEKIITPSPSRLEKDCPAFPRCGGCDFRHISYKEELKFKWQRVEDVLHRITGINLSPEEILGADHIANYRNKAQFPVGTSKGETVMGFYRERSHEIIPIDNCRIQSKQCKALLNALKKWMKDYNIPPYNEETEYGIVRHLFVRTSIKTSDTLVCIVTNSDNIPHKDALINELLKASEHICGIVQSVNKEVGNKILGNKFVTLFGNDFIYDYIGDLKFKVSVQSFFQVNTEQAFKLYSRAKEYAGLTGNENVIDLYCGTGTVGLFMADKAKSLFGAEIVPEAVHDAILNAELNNIKNAKFICADATSLCANDIPVSEKNIVFVDPPRKGLTDDLIHTISSLSPEKVIYISCDPATMARDLKTFIADGYEPQKCTAVDMFPRTRHVETVVLLSKLNEAKHHVTVELKTDELDLTPAEAKASYEEIREYVNQKYSLTVSDLNIAQVKRKHGIIERENYNLPKSLDSKQPQCTREKENAINEALRYFKMI